ncbi:MAG: hypothetical protein QM715_02595 [Nibricoccus sp.]
MKNKLRSFAVDCWHILTEVPGWPDAPRQLRLRRLLPAVVPVAAIVLLFLWNLAWNGPRIQNQRTTFQPLLALQQEVADLQLASSDTKAIEAATRASEAANMLLAQPKQLVPVLDELARTARAKGWDATFQALPTPATPQPEALLQYVTARGKLAPTPGNAQSFASLLVLLEQFSPPNRSIDLTRLSIRADEQGKLTAEVFLRAGCRIPQ